MARRSKQEMRAEFDRLYGIFETIVAFKKRSVPKEHLSSFDAVPSREAMLNWVETGKATLSGLISGTNQAIHDFSCDLYEEGAFGDKKVQDFLELYSARHDGRSYFSDVGDPIKDATKILRRGVIRNKTEWFLIKAIMDDVEQTSFTPSEQDQLSQMRVAFEQKGTAG